MVKRLPPHSRGVDTARSLRQPQSGEGMAVFSSAKYHGTPVTIVQLLLSTTIEGT